MYIKYIILNGFKSHARETIIGPLDEHFNGITGAEGTGKSTSLDAICFLLETPTSAVEGGKLEDFFSETKLELEHDDSVIKTAKVSIVFDNTDKDTEKCPVGYESCEEIVISRNIEQRSGEDKDEREILSKRSVVTEPFESIDFDVKNPNFMISPSNVIAVVKNMKLKELFQLIQGHIGARELEELIQKTRSRFEACMRKTTSVDSEYKKVTLGYLKGIKRERQAGVSASVSKEELSWLEQSAGECLANQRETNKLADEFNSGQSDLDDSIKGIMQSAYKGINIALGFTMKTFLPGSKAKLVPVSSSNMEDGVLIHVNLDGSVWKESLEELSGEQRSLVALAFLLAISSYNPNLFLILDQVDAALDSNQTCSMSTLLNEKYSDVQLICISQKEEMYNNANVLFTTTMEDGTSRATRLCLKEPTQSAKQRSSQNRKSCCKFFHVLT